MKTKVLLIIKVTVLFALSSPLYSQGPGDSPTNLLATVKSIMKQSCSVAGCHSGKNPSANLSLEQETLLASVLGISSLKKAELKIVEPGAPEKSDLIAKVKGAAGIVGKRMPLNHDPLTEEQIRQIEEWIKSLAASSTDANGILNPGFISRGPEFRQPNLKSKSPAQSSNPRRYSRPVFWGTRLVNLPTTVTPGKGDFLFRISHRFQPAVSSGWNSFFGLDGTAYILFSFGYGITDDLMMTIGRSRLYQEWEFNVDWAFLEQGGNGSLPFSASLHTGGSLVSQDEPPGAEWSGRFRLSALVSLSCQLNDRVSLLLVPAFSSNTNFWEPDSEGTFALGIGGRFVVFDEVSVIAEWVPHLAGYNDRYPGWGLGVEKNIGGHVFQFFVTNSIGLTAAQYLPGGDLSLRDGDFRVGFNIFRIF